jgi:hypothetical protein
MIVVMFTGVVMFAVATEASRYRAGSGGCLIDRGVPATHLRLGITGVRSTY